MVLKFVSVLQRWENYLEKATRDYQFYDDKTANAGNKNWNRFSRIFDIAIYGKSPVKDGYAWCACAPQAAMVEAYGAEEMKRLMLGVPSAGCPEIENTFKRAKRFYSTPQYGDLVTFGGGTNAAHIGTVIDVADNKITTFEGNTSSAQGVVANGGACRIKTYSKSYNIIRGYCRPDYREEDFVMTKEETVALVKETVTAELFEKLYENMLSVSHGDDHAEWADEATAFAKETGLFKGDGNGNFEWSEPITRQEVAKLLQNFAKLTGLSFKPE